VAAEIVGCLGLLAMRNAVDRLHYAGSAATVGPALVAAAVCVREGVVSASGLAALLVAVTLALGGSVVGTATIRLVRLRQQGSLESTAAERERA
jgi:multisubunit Na+/H+ antiporter MnhG subunit